jgi:secreted Zn-dependent insulinase-like peptidase
VQTHQDNVKQNVLLNLLALIGKQPAFHQLRSVEQLGYIALLRQRNDSGVRGLQFIIQSTAKDPANLDARVENFLKMFESTLYQMSDAEFKVRCASLSTYLLFDLALLHICFSLSDDACCLVITGCLILMLNPYTKCLINSEKSHAW